MNDNAGIGVAFLFGFGYNALIGWLHKRNRGDNGLAALEVVGGVLAVLLIGSFIQADKHYAFHAFGATYQLNNGQSAAWIFFRLFLGAGSWMVVGSVWRYLNTVE